MILLLEVIRVLLNHQLLVDSNLLQISVEIKEVTYSAKGKDKGKDKINLKVQIYLGKINLKVQIYLAKSKLRTQEFQFQ